MYVHVCTLSRIVIYSTIEWECSDAGANYELAGALLFFECELCLDYSRSCEAGEIMLEWRATKSINLN